MAVEGKGETVQQCYSNLSNKCALVEGEVQAEVEDVISKQRHDSEEAADGQRERQYEVGWLGGESERSKGDEEGRSIHPAHGIRRRNQFLIWPSGWQS